MTKHYTLFLVSLLLFTKALPTKASTAINNPKIAEASSLAEYFKNEPTAKSFLSQFKEESVEMDSENIDTTNTCATLECKNNEIVVVISKKDDLETQGSRIDDEEMLNQSREFHHCRLFEIKDSDILLLTFKEGSKCFTSFN